ncbi:uncharacterized protein BDR25DRAFT_345319 [Lindgomyces ingoldianus]|uniref:Uncharacterized protein n=1 Tax=Lindgomyces ingoldianus TaxID=673940 RepID=A0ACB6QI94_9PLEO|nr:uncharacterized protein BDR25DRAFT_345319 [Lindgomyces ingoldianus]KAF2466714.1 hypothetical protein BDR25DRAFT_345319 [Lindgomyces ingoldianus]
MAAKAFSSQLKLYNCAALEPSANVLSWMSCIARYSRPATLADDEGSLFVANTLEGFLSVGDVYGDESEDRISIWQVVAEQLKMSGLEVVASIAGVAGAAIKLSVTLNDVADDLGSAGRDVRYISNEMASFSQVLRLVHSSLEDSQKVAGSTVIRSALETLPQLLEQCGLVYLEANGLMTSLKPSTGRDSSLPFMKRVRFIFQKSRINVLRSLLDSSKSTLNLLLVTLNIEMAKTRSPNRELMDQLQSERKAFIRVVASQSKALDEALKEVDKAKKEASKLKSKVDKEKQREKEKEQERIPEQKPGFEPQSLGMLPSPSVTSLAYTPPQIDKAPQNSIVKLALSLEAPGPKYTGTPAQPTHPDTDPYGQRSCFCSPPTPPYPSSSPPPPPTFNAANDRPKSDPNRLNAKRVFSDPGPPKTAASANETLHPGGANRERSRSPYGFSRVPRDEPPKVERSRAPPPSHSPSNTAQDETPSTPEAERKRAPYTFQSSPKPEANDTLSPEGERGRKPYTYKAYRPPGSQPEASASLDPSPGERQRMPYGGATQFPASDPNPPYTSQQHPPYSNSSPRPPPSSPSTNGPPPRPKVPPPPPPCHGTTYVALTPYTSHEVGHLTLAPFDILVDVVSYIPDDETLPYPTAFDATPMHYWQASLHNRRGPRGLFPHSIVCRIEDDRLAEKVKECWFANGVHLIADMAGRVWVGPEWTFVEPLRRRSKWWAEEF